MLINTLEFAQKKQSLQGEVLVKDLPRLQEMVSPACSDSKIHFALEGGRGVFGLPGMHLYIDATLQVLCQRCLTEMSLKLGLGFDYVVSKEPPAELDELDEADWLEAVQDFDLVALIEDELLLALPIAPAHDFACAKQAMQSGEKPNPFAVLKTLKSVK
ncbi:MAG TPA: YceD family protein [Methylophilus sp.]|nr:YceD family protein [Methylophilus sp.]HQQ32916.1 YceD family protein [Methylophilus sp.]